MSNSPDWTALTDFACALADAAAQEILPHFRRPIAVEDKPGMADFDPVTEADRAGERAMRTMIAERFPDHGIDGEEFGQDRRDAHHVWVLDPIDGTRAFIAGLPSWTTLVALEIDRRPVIGVIAQPYIGETFIGTPEGAFFRQARLHVRPCPGLNKAICATTGLSWFSDDQKARFARFEAQARLVRMGFDAYAYAMLAMGLIDCVAEAGLKPHDLAALVPVVQGAGGRVTDWQGGQDFSRGEVLAAGDPRVLDEAVACLKDRG